MHRHHYTGCPHQQLVKLVLLFVNTGKINQQSIQKLQKNYSSTLEVDLPHKPGVLGHITSLIGLNKGNIVNLEIIKKEKKEHLTFSFDLQIKDLKNFTNLISQIKQSDLKFKNYSTQTEKNAFIEESLKILKETNALIEGHLFFLQDCIVRSMFNALNL